jgi:hypothetical protein
MYDEMTDDVTFDYTLLLESSQDDFTASGRYIEILYNRFHMGILVQKSAVAVPELMRSEVCQSLSRCKPRASLCSFWQSQELNESEEGRKSL